MNLHATVLGILILFCWSCSSTTPVIALNPQEIPEKSYLYTLGSEDNPEVLSCKLQRFTHPESGIEVSVIGMIHMATPEFYNRVHHLALEHDVTLREGVYGSPGISPHHFLVQYIGSYFSRVNYYTGLVPQNHYLVDSGNEINADMSLKEFSNEGSFYTPLLQLVALPIIIVGGEINNLALYTKYQFSGAGLTERLKINELSRNRQILFSRMRETEEKKLPILPGIITSRNKQLLKTLDHLVAQKEDKSFFIPWGAAHSYDIEQRLITRGFEKSSPPEWLTSVDFHSINQGDSSQFYIPLLYYHYKDQKTYDYSFLFGIFKGFYKTKESHSSVLWNLLYSSSKTPSRSRTTVFPLIFDRPVFYTYTSSSKKTRLQALLFFDLEWNK